MFELLAKPKVEAFGAKKRTQIYGRSKSGLYFQKYSVLNIEFNFKNSTYAMDIHTSVQRK